jgi:hypothetical protein
LGGEDGGDEEFEGVFVVEGALGVGVVLFEEGEDEVDAGLAGGGGFFGHEAPVEVIDFGFHFLILARRRALSSGRLDEGCGTAGQTHVTRFRR